MSHPSQDLSTAAGTDPVAGSVSGPASGSASGSVPDRFENPGPEPHVPRRADVDPAAAKRAERQVAALFTVSMIGTIGAIVAYVALPVGGTVGSVRVSTMAIGIALFLSLFGIGTAAVHWAKTLMVGHEQFEDRHPQRSDEPTRAAAVAELAKGAEESGIARRGVLKGAAASALALFPLALAVPLVGEVGSDWNVSRFRHTLWERGKRLTRDPSGDPILASDVTVGSVFHVIPEGLRDSEHWIEEKAKAVVLMVRLDPSDLIEAEDRRSWSYEGIVAYSKICTHVGCPVALYERDTHHVLCPCHQSTFDISDGAKVVFGPAKRALPQLPITVDDEGYLVAQDDFDEPIGPSYWERLS